MWGQRDVLAMPEHDVGLFMLQVRPLRPGPSVTLIHDTIQVHYGSNALIRAAKRAFLRRVGVVSSRILTVSEYSRASIERDLGVERSQIDVVRYPVDEDMVKRVHELRETLPSRDTVLFVGQYAPHKNLDRLLRAFTLTTFARGGGELLLVGGAEHERRRLERLAEQLDARISVEGSVTQARLDELYATCRALVLPSLAEGFGLPAWEAAACGLPVCVSDRAGLREVISDPTLRFDPTSLEDIATHVDAVLDRASDVPGVGPSGSDGGSLKSFAESIVESVRRSIEC
jgi:glycosyltransferase involved in cell wall biosynthesis